MTKYILSIILLLCSFFIKGADFYFSQFTGNDITGNGSQAAPYQSIAKFNSLTHTGNDFYFQRGGVYPGSMTLNGSGTSLNPIIIGAYGTGDDPVISGFALVSAWTNMGGNVWESTSAVTSLTTCSLLSIGNTNTAKARTPNTGWWLLQSSTATSLTDNVNLNAATLNWTGAEAVVRVLMYVIKRSTVTSASGATINYGNIGAAEAAGFGYFLQNDLRCLDIQNEWVFNASTKKISIYSTVNPSTLNVQVPTVQNGIVMGGRNFITIDNIQITGYNNDGILGNQSPGQQSGCIFQNGGISFCGVDALDLYPNSPNLKLINNTVTDCNNRGLYTGSSQAEVIISNTVLRIGLLPGMMGGEDSGGTGIVANGDNGYVAFNDVQYCGYCCYRLDGNSTVVEKNNGNYATGTKDDGGIYYWYSVQFGNTPHTQLTRTFRDNTATNFVGAAVGSPFGLQGAGVYFDGQSPNVNCYHNTIGNDNDVLTGRYGIFVNGGHDIKCDSNISYNSFYPYYAKKIGGAMYGNTLTNNQLIVFNNNSDASCGSQKYAITVFPDSSNMPVTWVSTNNVIANPRNQTAGWIFRNFCSGTCGVCNTLAQWQSVTGKDVGSTSSPKIVNSIDSILFLRNSTAGAVTIPLSQNFIDMRNVAYPGTITLQPYSGAVLIRNGGIANTPPLCQTIAPVTLTQPTNFCTLNAVATSTMSGTIVSYAWSQTAGTAAVIVSPSNATTQITGLSTGVSTFRYVATDNNGLTCNSSVNITVNPQPVTPTVTGAATPSTITLPTSGTNLTSTASGGTITTYGWRILSGIGGTITSPTSQNTSITGLVAGNYSVEVEVTNNFSLKGRDTVFIVVNPLPVAPTASAGIDATITLPINFVALNASASVAGSTPIVSYAWVKLTGSSAGITNPSAQVTQSTGLVASVYTFEVTVTDAGGLSDKDTVQVTCLAAPVLSPPIVTVAPNFSATLPLNFITLSASVVVPSGVLSSLTWSQISGSAVTITTPNALVTTVTGITLPGTYQFKLVATSSVALSGADTITVTISEVTPIIGIKFFNAATAPKNINLSWAVHSVPSNALNFTLYKWDGGKYKLISTIKEIKNILSYSYKDNVTGKGTFYYRLIENSTRGTVSWKELTVLKKN